MQTSKSTLSLFLIAILFSAQIATAHGSSQATPGNNHNAKALVGVLDSTLVWNWGSTSYDQLVQGSFNAYTNTDLTDSLNQRYSGGAWINSTQDNLTYDGNNNILTDTNQTWSGSVYTNHELFTYTYDGNNNRLSEVSLLRSGGIWTPNAQYFYHYNGNILISSDQQAYVSGAWTITDSFTYAYDGNNHLLTEVDLYYSSGAWANNNEYTYTYSGNNMTSFTQATWTGSAWSTESKDTYTYSGGNLATDINQIYNGNISSNNYELIYGYDVNNNLVSIVNQQYMGNVWVNDDSTHLYYHETGTPNSVVNVNTLDAVISVYPNPAQSVVNVVVSNVTAQPLIATLYDITGRVVKTIPVNNNVTQISLNNISAGMYHLVLADEQGNKAVKQVIIQ
jgi:hypothetical protein